MSAAGNSINQNIELKVSISVCETSVPAEVIFQLLASQLMNVLTCWFYRTRTFHQRGRKVPRNVWALADNTRPRNVSNDLSVIFKGLLLEASRKTDHNCNVHFGIYDVSFWFAVWCVVLGSEVREPNPDYSFENRRRMSCLNMNIKLILTVLSQLWLSPNLNFCLIKMKMSHLRKPFLCNQFALWQ